MLMLIALAAAIATLIYLPISHFVLQPRSVRKALEPVERVTLIGGRTCTFRPDDVQPLAKGAIAIDPIRHALRHRSRWGRDTFLDFAKIKGLSCQRGVDDLEFFLDIHYVDDERLPDAEMRLEFPHKHHRDLWYNHLAYEINSAIRALKGTTVAA